LAPVFTKKMSTGWALPSESYTVIEVEKFEVLEGSWSSQGSVGGTAAASRFAVTSMRSVAWGWIAEVGACIDETEDW
jgi:hypothetical protein